MSISLKRRLDSAAGPFLARESTREAISASRISPAAIPIRYRIANNSRKPVFDQAIESVIRETHHLSCCDREEGGRGRECSTPGGSSMVFAVSPSQPVKEREAPENVEARLVTGTGFLRHALQYG